jgi:hypothetical protein
MKALEIRFFFFSFSNYNYDKQQTESNSRLSFFDHYTFGYFNLYIKSMYNCKYIHNNIYV